MTLANYSIYGLLYVECSISKCVLEHSCSVAKIEIKAIRGNQKDSNAYACAIGHSHTTYALTHSHLYKYHSIQPTISFESQLSCKKVLIGKRCYIVCNMNIHTRTHNTVREGLQKLLLYFYCSLNFLLFRIKSTQIHE